MSKVPKFHFDDHPSAKVAKPAKPESDEVLTFATFAPFANGKSQNQLLHPATEEKKACLEVHPAICSACPWYELNPWTHYPDFAAWCHLRMEHLVVNSLPCEEFRPGEVPPRQAHQQNPTVQARPERILTCADCLHFEANLGPNPRQGWGRCAKQGKGRYGCAMACEASLTDEGQGA